jgi:hypothetical protein
MPGQCEAERVHQELVSADQEAPRAERETRPPVSEGDDAQQEDNRVKRSHV